MAERTWEGGDERSGNMRRGGTDTLGTDWKGRPTLPHTYEKEKNTDIVKEVVISKRFKYKIA